MNILTFVRSLLSEIRSITYSDLKQRDDLIVKSFDDLKNDLDRGVFEQWTCEVALRKISQLMISNRRVLVSLSSKAGRIELFGAGNINEEILFRRYLEDLQKHIENSHNNLLPLDASFPFNHFSELLISKAGAVNQILQDVKQHPFLNDGLKSVLAGFLESFNSDKASTCTYRKVFYFISFQSGLSEVINEKEGAGRTVEEAVYAFLFVRNFNSPDFYAHYVSRVEKRLEDIGIYKDQAFYLLHEIKTVKQYPYFFTENYEPESTDIKTAACNYLREELQYIKESESLGSAEFRRGDEGNPYYFHVSMTVAQLNLFFRLMLDSGIIITKRKSQLFQFIANDIGTIRKDNLSVRSIKNKAYGPDKKTVLKVKQHLLTLLSAIDRY
ncbi:hypothetical protein [Desertivirga brevis]|uniref:hypothetical protein n=1 Tax=Desertivirga brevis TaxID=2810310 RepID=UPI001A971A2D|nr:hypothetical protein [Pedobacter sp. SYSU D00873]